MDFPHRWDAPPASGTPRIVTVHGPAGSGKTTLLRHWAALSRVPTIWVDAEPEGTCPFIQRLLDALGAPPPDPPTHDPHTAVTQLVEHLSLRRHLLIVDAAEHLRAPTCVTALGDLARRLPDGTVLVVAGRQLPAVGWSRLKLNGNVVALTQDDLLLDVPRLMTAGLDADAAARVLAVSGGHADAARRAADALTAGEDPETAAHGVLRAAVGHLDAHQTDLLAELAVLGYADPVAFDCITGRHEGAELASRLGATPLPLVTSTEGGGRLTIAEPLRRLLVADLAAAQPERLAALTDAAATHLVAIGEPDHAFDVLQATHDREALAQLIRTEGAQQSLTGHPERTRDWLAALGHDTVLAEPGLLLISAITLALLWDFSDMHAHVAAVGAFPVRRFELHDRPGEVIVAGTALDPRSKPWPVAGLVVRGFQSLAMGEYVAAEGILVTLGSLARSYPLLDIWRCVFLAHVYAMTRRPAQGQAVVAYAQSLAEANGLEEHPWMVGLDVVSAQYAGFAGDPARSRRHLKAAIEKLAMFEAGFISVRLLCTIQAARTADLLGDRPVARSLVAQAQGFARQRPDFRDLVEGLQELGVRVGSDKGPPRLTASEVRVLRELPSHASVPVIARGLQQSPATVRGHIRSLHRKLGTHDRASTVAIARTWGLLE